MPITIKDLAKMAGVSHTTVSRALNDSPLLSDKTKKRIQALAKEQGYQPNFTARALKANKSYTYGLFFSTLQEASTNNFVFEAVKGVKNNLPKGYRLTVESIDTIGSMDLINKKNYDGIMLVSQRYEDIEFANRVIKNGVPIVVLNRLIESNQISSIAYDDDDGIYRAVKYLAAQGHRNIAFLGGKRGFYNSDRRFEGYKKGLKEANIQVVGKRLKFGDFTIESGYNACQHLLFDCQFSALVCANDEMAIGAMKALREAGYKVGKDISVIGFDDNDINPYLVPPLTSIKRPIAKLTEEGITILNDLVSGNRKQNCKKLLHTELVIRESAK